MEVDDLDQEMMAELDAQLLATTLDEAYDDVYLTTPNPKPQNPKTLKP